jgi:RNA polymerase I-specific transcription initiation factor RRN6
VDEASAKLPELFSSEAHQLFSELQAIASGPVVGLTGSSVSEVPTIATLYDSILENWIAPLPANIPVSVRQNKERLARRIAAELILASTRIFRSSHTLQLPATQAGHSQDSGMALSNTSSEPPSSGPLSSQPLSSLPTLAQTHTESPPSAVSAIDPLSRLRRYLCIENADAKPLPTGIFHTLSHWQLGTDPSSYSWEASEEVLQEEEDEVIDDAKHEKKRESAKRKKERREKRQKRENDLFMATTFSQPAIPRSSPGPFFSMGVSGEMSSQMPGLSQSQSQSQVVGGMGGLGVQSQVEPGRHGGRPILKKKKGKKRVGGF